MLAEGEKPLTPDQLAGLIPSRTGCYRSACGTLVIHVPRPVLSRLPGWHDCCNRRWAGRL